ncbi:glycosyltransferase family 2 protein [Dyella sp. 2HG41-7]|uniref:glycosyltransferase family 2 protein n=1 Tax=Dyella sp. 2HG41-7 TaxID=2883239 RepID=UPI001F178064|nr:glycosyltransferase family 2 protein [Dyella sp. 2HG41-7]
MVSIDRQKQPQTTVPPIYTVASSAPHRLDESRQGHTAPVSVVVPCYRCVDTIEGAVASVAAQQVLPAEVLLVDDGSPDDTLKRLHEVASRYAPGWVKVIALARNAGPSAARNKGWEKASQPWIAFLDADDSWHPEKLALQMDAIEEDSQIALIAHDMNVQSRTAPAPTLHYPLNVRVFPNHLMMLRSPFPTASIILRRDLPFRFDERRRRAEDFMLWAQILLNGYRCAKINQILASWHKPPFGAGGLSGDLAAMFEAANDVRKTLHEQGLLSWWQWKIMDVFSLIRYARRRALTFKRRHAGLFFARHNA